MKTILLACLLAFAAGAGCSGNKSSIMQREGGVFTVIGAGETETKALEAAISRANDHCGDEDKKVVFLEEKKEYTGTLPERANRTIAKVPGVRRVFTSGEDYKVELKARCE